MTAILSVEVPALALARISIQSPSVESRSRCWKHWKPRDEILNLPRAGNIITAPGSVRCSLIRPYTLAAEEVARPAAAILLGQRGSIHQWQEAASPRNTGTG